MNEYLSEQQTRRQIVPQSFNMAGLLQEMREIDEAAVYQQATPQRGIMLYILLLLITSSL